MSVEVTDKRCNRALPLPPMLLDAPAEVPTTEQPVLATASFRRRLDGEGCRVSELLRTAGSCLLVGLPPTLASALPSLCAASSVRASAANGFVLDTVLLDAFAGARGAFFSRTFCSTSTRYHSSRISAESAHRWVTRPSVSSCSTKGVGALSCGSWPTVAPSSGNSPFFFRLVLFL